MPPNDTFQLITHQRRLAYGREHPELKDCWPCRITSAAGLFGASCYIIYHTEKAKHRYVRGLLLCTASGLMTLSMARLFDIYPFGPTIPALPNDYKNIKAEQSKSSDQK